MSEDRHTFSEPRPIAGLALPTWDVDVFRDGVPEPILTLRVDETNLPPRRSKKKKIVWKLPDSVDQTPRFGADEKRRLLDLFKNLKKERRKSKQKTTTTRNSITADIEALQLEVEAAALADDNPPPSPPNGTNGSTATASGDPNPVLTNGKKKETNGNAKPTNGHHHHPTTTTNGHKQPDPATTIHSPASAVPSSEAAPDPVKPETPIQSTQPQTQQQMPSKPPPGMGLTRRNSAPLPPGIPEAVAASAAEPHINGTTTRHIAKPPPGMSRAQSMPLEENSKAADYPAPTFAQAQSPEIRQSPPSSAGLQAPPPQPTTNGHYNHHHQPQHPPQQPRQHSLSPPGGPVINPLLQPPPPQLPPPARFLKFPTTTMPPELFAQQVANLYISLLQSGQVEELLLYYTLTAQKSLSLKSAKSMCHTPNEMKTQLTSLVGCVFAVQGITVQQGFLNSLLLIWSGICQLQGQQHGFCQTLVLAPLPTSSTTSPNNGVEDANSIQYQIQNDALVLLTND